MMKINGKNSKILKDEIKAAMKIIAEKYNLSFDRIKCVACDQESFDINFSMGLPENEIGRKQQRARITFYDMIRILPDFSLKDLGKKIILHKTIYTIIGAETKSQGKYEIILVDKDGEYLKARPDYVSRHKFDIPVDEDTVDEDTVDVSETSEASSLFWKKMQETTD